MCELWSVVVFVACFVRVFFFKQKTAYEMRISDWSSDVCSSDLRIYSVNMCAGCKYPPELRNRASRAGLGSGPREAENPMRIEGDYAKDGYATIRRLVQTEVAANLLRLLEIDLAGSGKTFGTFSKLHTPSHQSTDYIPRTRRE